MPKNPLLDKMGALEKSDPNARITGDLSKLNHKSFIDKIISLSDRLELMASKSDNIKDVAISVQTLQKVMDSVSKNPVYLMKMVSELTEEQAILFNSLLEQKNLKKAFSNKKINMKEIL